MNPFKEFLKTAGGRYYLPDGRKTQNRFYKFPLKITIRPQDGCYKHKKERDKANIVLSRSFYVFHENFKKVFIVIFSSDVENLFFKHFFLSGYFSTCCF